MGNVSSGLCDICLSSQRGGSGDYAYETFQKIPFFGPLSEYLRKIKGLIPGGNNQNNIFSNISNFGQLINPSTSPNTNLPFPSGPFSLSNLINNTPLDIIKSQGDLLNVDKTTYVRKIKKSNYQELSTQLAGSNQMYTDPEFPPNDESIGQLEDKKFLWKRIKDILPNAIFVNDNISPSDILQGSLGDCYLLSALASLAEQDYRIKSIFPKLQINPNGLYMARILHNGVLQEVVIDDYFPVTAGGKVGFAQPSGGRQIWVMVIEKCWAKLYGSYANIVGGLPDEVLHSFCSAPVFYRSISPNKEKQEALWAQMLECFKNGALLCCGTRGDNPSIQDQGFVKGHAYTILGVYERPQKMIKLRNPWGHKQWKGRASDYDDQFWNSVSPADKQALDYEDSKRKSNTDGIFFVLWEDFLTYFQLVDICKINDNANYNFIEASFRHLTPSLFQIEVGKTNPNDKLTLALTQQNLRGKGTAAEDRGYSRSFLALGKLDEQSGRYSYVNSNSAKTFPDNYLELDNIQPGKYVLYSKYLWNNGNQINKATLSAYSAVPVVLKQNTQNPQRFLEDIFYDHASKNSNRKNLSSPNDWVCSDMLLNKGAFGYVVANVDASSKQRLSFQLNEMQFTQKKMELFEPYRGRGQILEEVNSSKPLIILFGIHNQAFPSKITVPQPQIRALL